jgi:formylglycine-generating enzyme required for sulfatase activity
MKTSPVDGAQLVYVPGSGDVESFWIDQSAVTTSMFEKFVNAVSYTTDAEKSGVGYVWTSLGEQPATQFPGQTGVVLEWKLISGVDWKNPPRDESRGNGDEILQVSWNDALAYCQWAGRELLRADEWELALATEPSVEFYNTRNGLGEWGQNKATSVYRVVLGYQNIRWGYNLIFQDWGFAENRSANILTFRCKEK